MSRVLKATNIQIDANRQCLIEYQAASTPKHLVVVPDEERHSPQMVSQSELTEQARYEAEQIVAQARLEAERMIAEAQETRQRMQEEAWNQGFHSGYNDGLVQGMEKADHELQETRDEIAAMREQTALEINRIWKETERDMLLLSLKIAEKILHRELCQDPLALTDLIRSTTAELHLSSSVSVKLHPSDYGALEEAGRIGDLSNDKVRFVCDPALDRGDCIVDTGRGVVDAGVQRQLDTIKEAMLAFGGL